MPNVQISGSALKIYEQRLEILKKKRQARTIEAGVKTHDQLGGRWVQSARATFVAGIGVAHKLFGL